MFIIWGSKGREIEKARGAFHCPSCGQVRPYRNVEVKKFFTLYFVPLFPTETLGEYIECQGCKQSFKSEVLKYEPPSELDRICAFVAGDLSSGTPLQMVAQKLCNHGIDSEYANHLVIAVAEGQARHCGNCNVHFCRTIGRCTLCGNPLSEIIWASPPQVAETSAPAPGSGSELCG